MSLWQTHEAATVTTAEARSLVKSNPSAYRAAFVEAPGWPLLDHPQARVTLHTKVGQAYDELRARKESLVKIGYKVTAGSLGKSVLRLERGDDVRVIGLDKPRKRG